MGSFLRSSSYSVLIVSVPYFPTVEANQVLKGELTLVPVIGINLAALNVDSIVQNRHPPPYPTFVRALGMTKIGENSADMVAMVLEIGRPFHVAHNLPIHGGTVSNSKAPV